LDELACGYVCLLRITTRVPTLEDETVALDPSKLLHSHQERIHEERRGPGRQQPNPVDFPRLLRLTGQWRKYQVENENNREPDQPHGHLGGDGWREFSRTPRRAPAPALRRATVRAN
jgi:hypothetical protein